MKDNQMQAEDKLREIVYQYAEQSTSFNVHGSKILWGGFDLFGVLLNFSEHIQAKLTTSQVSEPVGKVKFSMEKGNGKYEIRFDSESPFLLDTALYLAPTTPQEAISPAIVESTFFHWLDARCLGKTITEQFLRDEYEEMTAQLLKNDANKTAEVRISVPNDWQLVLNNHHETIKSLAGEINRLNSEIAGLSTLPMAPNVDYKAYSKRLEDALLKAEVMYHPTIKTALASKPTGLE